MARSWRIVLGVLLVLLGAVLLGDTAGLYEFGGVRTLLPGLLVLWGLWSLVRHRFRRLFWPLVLVLVGVLWQLVVLDRLTAAEAWEYWPAVLILLGVSMLLGRRRRRSVTERYGDRVELVAISETVDRRFDASVGHGEATAVFGDVVVDLRDREGDPPVTLEAVAVFGDVTVRVPPEWTVSTETVSIAGRVADTRRERPSGRSPDLALSGVAVFGNVTVTD